MTCLKQTVQHHHHHEALKRPLLNIGLLKAFPSFSVLCGCHPIGMDSFQVIGPSGGRPGPRLSALGCHSRILLVHLPSFDLAICPAHLQLALVILSKTSSTPVLLRISSFRNLSLRLISSIDRSILRCVFCSFRDDALVRVKVSAL